MSAGLDQLCLAACEPGKYLVLNAYDFEHIQSVWRKPSSSTHLIFAGLSEPINEAAEIKVVELDAYASVADLIQAAISARLGAATLKEVSLSQYHHRLWHSQL